MATLNTNSKLSPAFALLLFAAVVAAILATLPSKPALAAGGATCASEPATTTGKVEQTITVPTNGTYNIWARLKPASSAPSSFVLRLDGQCYAMGGNSLAAGSLQWVDYSDATPANKTSAVLTAGSYSLTSLAGNDGLQLDRIMLLPAGCTPVGDGDNCLNDTVAPTVAISDPASSGTVSNTTQITATASDNDSINKLDFYLDGTTLIGSDTSAPYAVNWDSRTAVNGMHSVTARAYDQSNNSTTSSPVTVTVANPSNPSDSDSDGVADSEEDAGPNNGDANNDGTADASQATVISFINRQTSQRNVLVASGDCSSLSGAASLAAAEPNQPLGYWRFSLNCAAPGQAASVKLYLGKKYDTAGWQVAKVEADGAIVKTFTDQVVIGTDNLAGNAVTSLAYSLTDGGDLDEDQTTNATIADPLAIVINNSSLLATTGQTIIGLLVTGIMVTAVALGTSLAVFKRRKRLGLLPIRAKSAQPTKLAYSRIYMRGIVVVLALSLLGLGSVGSLRAFSYGPMVASEPESGSLSGVSTIADAQASGGQVVQFNDAGPARPSALNTGYAAGTTFIQWGFEDVPDSNFTFDSYEFNTTTRGYYAFYGNNLMLRNCKFNQGVIFYGDNIRIENCDVDGGISFSGSANSVAEYNNIHDFAGDGFHVTSDTGQVSNLVIQHNYVHAPTPGPLDHADGIQVRGSQGLTLYNNVFDLGPWTQVNGVDVLNAAVFIQNANGGNSSLTIDRNYLNGGGVTLQIGPMPNSTITNNFFGTDAQYGDVTNLTNPGDLLDSSGNKRDGTGEAIQI